MKVMVKAAAANIGLAVLYFALAKLGLSLAFVDESATAIWPPTGVSLAAVLLLGYRVWPGILAGAFLANLSTDGHVASSAAIACGNALEALAGGWLVQRFAGGVHAFERVVTSLRFLALAGIAATAVSATVGVVSLGLAGLASWSDAGAIWLTWWLGDMVSLLLITPMLVVWRSLPAERSASRWGEAVVVLAVHVLVSGAIFQGWLLNGSVSYPVSFLCLPTLIWSSYRFRQHGATLASLILALIAIWGTLDGRGPFGNYPPDQSLVLLQALVATASMTMLILAALVDEQRRSDDAVRRGEERVRRIADSVPALISYIDKDLRYQFNNQAYEDWFGQAPEAILGKPVREVLGEQAFEALRPRFESALAGRRVSYEAWTPYREGGRRFIHADYIPEFGLDGTVRGMYVLVLDITGRKKAEEALRDSEGMLAQAQQMAHVGSWQLDLQNSDDLNANELRWSDETYRIFGFEPGSVPVTNDLFFSLVHPDDRQGIIDAVGQALRDNRPYEFDHRIIRPDGTERIIHEWGRVETDTEGRPRRMLGTSQDITERRLMEDALERHKGHLEELVAQRTTELEASHQRLRVSERMAALGTLSAGLGHDMGNLLLPVQARLDALRGGGGLAVEDREHVEVISQCVTYLQSLTRGLRLFAKDPGRDTAGAHTVLPTWINDVSSLYKSVLPRDIVFEVDADADLPSVAVAPHALTQAILNLVNNSREAIGPGNPGRVSIRMRVLPDGQAVRIVVEDTGPGMPAEVRARAFEPFFTTKTRRLSTGLGLSLVHGIVEAANGTVEVQSPVIDGRGTAIAIVVPLWRPAPSSAESSAGACRAAVGVADTRLNALLTSVLQGLGCMVVAANGEPGDVELWITVHSAESLAAARALRAAGRGSRIVVVGDAPSDWESLGARRLDPGLKVTALRRQLGELLDLAL